MPSITNFTSNFKGGTRKNRFLVEAVWPSGVGSPIATYHVLAATLPSSTLGRVTFPYRGRQVHFAGDREYEDWEISVLDDSPVQGTLWRAFQEWHKKINGHASNTHSANDESFTNLKQPWIVRQKDLNGNTIKNMRLIGCYPSIVGPIDFDMGSQVYNTFVVKMAYDYFQIF